MRSIFFKAICISCVIIFYSSTPSYAEQIDLLAKEKEDESQYYKDVEVIAEKPEVKRAFEYIVSLNKQNIDDLITLTEIPAPPFGEDKRALHFAKMIKDAGLKDVVIDDVGNVIARRPGKTGTKTVAIGAHLDTVFPMKSNIKVRIKGNRYIAPGIGDNTRGLVVLLSLIKAIEKTNIETEADILFIGNVGEEGLGDLRGVKHLFRQGAPKIDSFIAIDGGRNNRLVYGGIGSYRYRLVFRGDGGHSWGSFGLANPHHALARAIAIFDENALKITLSGKKTTYNVGRVGGGTSVNSIPFEAWAEIDMRSGSQDKLKDIDQVLREAVIKALAEENDMKTAGNDLTYELKSIGIRPAGVGDINGALVQHAKSAMQLLDLKPRLSMSSTDANIPISLGIPAITLSRGGISARVHSLDEWWENTDSHLAIQLSLIVLLAQSGIIDS